jgi:hypothetical protein
LGPAPSFDLTGLDEKTATAVRIRATFGLAFDLETIGRVAVDPTATSEFGTPLTPAEIHEIEDRNARADRITPIVRSYAADHQSEFGGIWMDQSRGGLVIVSFTDHLDAHRRALAALLDGTGAVAVVPARYPENQLRVLQDRIAADRAWFDTIPASLQGVGVDTTSNVLEIEVSTANPAIADLIAARYGVPPDALRVVSDGTGIALEPWGRIHGRVIGVPRAVLAELILNYASDRAGAECGIGDVGIGIAANGTFDLPCQGGHWTITAIRTIDDVVASGEVDLPPGGTASMILRPVGH